MGSEAGKRLKELFDTVDSSGRLSNEEMEEINRIIAEHTGAGGVLEAPDLNMLGVTDHSRFFENFSYTAKRRKKLMRTSIISRPYRLDCLRSTSCPNWMLGFTGCLVVWTT